MSKRTFDFYGFIRDYDWHANSDWIRHNAWKYDSRIVKLARESATQRIAVRNLKAAFSPPLEKVVDWINRVLMGQKRPALPPSVASPPSETPTGTPISPKPAGRHTADE